MSDSDEFSDQQTPPEVKDLAENTEKNLLPEKSKKRYEKAYQLFMNWRLEKKVKSFSETVLLAYFGEISNKFKPSTLWSTYSMLRTILNIKNNVNIANYPKLKSFLKRKGDGFKAKKSKILTAADIKKFIQEAPDSKYLLSKVSTKYKYNVDKNCVSLLTCCECMYTYIKKALIVYVLSDFHFFEISCLLDVCSNNYLLFYNLKEWIVYWKRSHKFSHSLLFIG